MPQYWKVKDLKYLSDSFVKVWLQVNTAQFVYSQPLIIWTFWGPDSRNTKWATAGQNPEFLSFVIWMIWIWMDDPRVSDNQGLTVTNSKLKDTIVSNFCLYPFLYCIFYKLIVYILYFAASESSWEVSKETGISPGKGRHTSALHKAGLVGFIRYGDLNVI